MARAKRRATAEVLGERVRALRVREGLDRKALADRAKVALTSVYFIEEQPGRTSPHLRTLERLAAALRCRVRDLFDDEAEPVSIGESSKAYYRLVSRLRDKPVDYIRAVERLADALDRGLASQSPTAATRRPGR